jgi:hypothetical protein
MQFPLDKSDRPDVGRTAGRLVHPAFFERVPSSRQQVESGRKSTSAVNFPSPRIRCRPSQIDRCAARGPPRKRLRRRSTGMPRPDIRNLPRRKGSSTPKGACCSPGGTGSTATLGWTGISLTWTVRSRALGPFFTTASLPPSSPSRQWCSKGDEATQPLRSGGYLRPLLRETRGSFESGFIT